MAKRRKYSAELKAKVALEALRGEQTLAELSARYNDQRPHSSLDDRTPTEAYFDLEIGSSLGSCPEMTRRNRAA